MNIDITEIIVSLLSLAITIATVLVIPYLKKNLTKQEQENLAYWVEVAVLAAEGMFKYTESGQEKYQYVIDFLHKQGLKFNEDEVEALIESAVYDLINRFEEYEVISDEQEDEVIKIGCTE